jgi:pseudaminic acid cytidylyltransferase
MRIAIIPARGGSKRIPHKNIRPFHGRPIIEYSIETAKASGLFDQIYVSTDDDTIAQIAQRAGAKIIPRSGYMAGDEAGTQSVVKAALLSLGAQTGTCCCIYPCAPMLRPETLVLARRVLLDKCYVVPVATWLRDPGQFYFGHTEAFLNDIPLLSLDTRLLPIDPATECDINTEEDWIRAEAMYARLYPERVGMQSA